MLQELRVNNLALIDALELDFADTATGLIVFTGETGAGKSIILQAVHLLTGGRSSPNWVRSDCDQAVIEALFDLGAHPELRAILEEHGLDNGADCVLRRLVSRRGRSRIYVNNRLATSRIVAEFAENLVSIASQHDHQQLLQSSHHIDFLDGYGELHDQRAAYRQVFIQWQKLRNRLDNLRQRDQDKEQRRDFLGYQLREINEIAPQPGEDEALAKERDLLKSSTTLADLCAKSYTMLQNRIAEPLGELRKYMEQVAELDPSVTGLAERIRSACFEIEDLEGALHHYSSSIPQDQGQLNQIVSRLADLRQLQRKYGPSLEDVVDFAERARSELASLDSLEQELAVLAKEAGHLQKQLLEQAGALSMARKQVAKRLTKAMQDELASLCFNQALFEVSFKGEDIPPEKRLFGTGQDDIEFFFSANPGEQVKPLASVVSGGELSRLMLAMKCILARRDRVDTVIFDEIDAGIGGEAAEAVGRKIDELAGHHQVFCITHLPQIAAHADVHYTVEKIVQDNRTRTTIRQLTEDERVAELARMLGGDNPTSHTLALAMELVQRNAGRSKRVASEGAV